MKGEHGDILPFDGFNPKDHQVGVWESRAC